MLQNNDMTLFQTILIIHWPSSIITKNIVVKVPLNTKISLQYENVIFLRNMKKSKYHKNEFKSTICVWG